MSEAAVNAAAEGAGSPSPEIEHRGWPASRYLLAVAVATALAIGALAWARPSLFTSPLVMAGLGRHLAESSPDSFYATRVAPILEAQCAGCHGPRLQRARLRLDSLGDLMLGGKNGRVVVPGVPAESSLYTRLLLPKTDRRAMPAGDKPPLAPDEIRVIELWIAAGASGGTRVDQIADAPPPPAPPVKVDTPDGAAVASARAPLEAQVEALAERYPGSVSYLSRSSADLAIDVQRLGESFRDDDLARLASVAGAVTRLDVSGTAITDAAAETLAGFVRLETLRMNSTNTGDAMLEALARLPALKAVALIDTHAGAQRVAQLREQGLRVYDARE